MFRSPFHIHPLEQVDLLKACRAQYRARSVEADILLQFNEMLSPPRELPREEVNHLQVYQANEGGSEDMFTIVNMENLPEQVNKKRKAYRRRWKCDNCNSENGPMNSFPFHCRQCSFNLCYSCMHMHHQGGNLIHRHQLLHMETSQNQNGIWRCAVCKKTSDTLRETFSFHCSTCGDFDICRNCYEPKRHPIHRHELKVVDTSMIYAHTGGSWVCGICGNSSRPCEVFSHHCGDCGFDVCQDCFKPRITRLHEHPLYKADPRHVYAQFNGGWRCCRCGSVYNNPVDNKPWHCQTCEFDLCNACMSPTLVEDQDAAQAPADVDMEDVPGADVPGPSMDRDFMLPPSHVGFQGPRRDVDRDEECRRLRLRIREMEMENTCIICQERPKNSFLLHGDGFTSHRCCCVECGNQLQHNDIPCPICRERIAQVVICYG